MGVTKSCSGQLLMNNAKHVNVSQTQPRPHLSRIVRKGSPGIASVSIHVRRLGRCRPTSRRDARQPDARKVSDSSLGNSRHVRGRSARGRGLAMTTDHGPRTIALLIAQSEVPRLDDKLRLSQHLLSKATGTRAEDASQSSRSAPFRLERLLSSAFLLAGSIIRHICGA